MIKNKKILIDCSNLQAGGGIQVALSFLSDLISMSLTDDFTVLLSPQMLDSITKETYDNNFTFIEMPQRKYRNLFVRSRYIRKIEKQIKPDVIFVVFGPSYNKSKVPKIVGYAIPHYIYEDSPYFQQYNLKEKLLMYLRRKVKVKLFRNNSTELIFETQDAQEIFCSKYKYDINKTHVVSNTLNSIFSNSELWIDGEFDFKASHSILCLTANYKHKNLDIIPDVIDSLINDFNFKDFKFILSLSRGELGFDKKYDPYIEYLGRVPLEKLPALYNSVSVLFMPTLLEVFSATYLEAMFMKVPIVASDMSFARDICNDCALYFEPTNAKDAAAKLKLLSKDFNKRDQLIRLGEINLKRFGSSKDRTIKYLDIISNIITTK
jgi:glycosyltransferase involved in cell wall biosynthesis